MTFVQVIQIEATPDKFDEILANSYRWLEETEGKRTVVREVIGRDRNNPNWYTALVYFDSYESAMKNSELEETQREAKAIEALASTVAFQDLDVIKEWS